MVYSVIGGILNMPNPPQKTGSNFSLSRKVGAAKLKEIIVQSSFTKGYRNREDVTLLPPGTMVTGSHDVMTNVSGRIASRKGYTIDGAPSTVVAPILFAVDWQVHTGDTRHLRAGFLTSAGNDGKLQFRYEDSSGNVTYLDLMTGLTSVSFNSADYWDTTNLQSLLLLVNGTSNIFDWSGAVTTLASATANTITLNGTKTWAQLGFYLTTGTVIINGTSYGYTGGTSTTTLTGVTPDPSAEPVDSVIYQKPRTTANSSITGLPSSFQNNLISALNNQVYVGSFVDNSVYVSKINNFKDFSFSTPRVVGEGALLTLDGTPTSFIPQENYMAISAGHDQWYETTLTLSADLTMESLTVTRLKTTSNQAAISQAATSKIKNDIVFISFEPIFNTLGRVDNVVLTPQVTDVSFPIVDDMDNYDFTDSSTIYWKQYAILAIPASSRVLIFNMTDPKNRFWECPLIMQISRFSIIDGELYGHSYQTSESYKLFDGYADRAIPGVSIGNPINAVVFFAFENSGIRPKTKSFNKLWIEGYISPTTILTSGIQYDQDGCATMTSYDISGTDSSVVCSSTSNNSLGKNSLGKFPLGGNLDVSSSQLPPRFNVIKTFPRTPYFNWQPSFGSSGVNQNWELLGFGTNASPTSEGENNITQ